MSQKQNVLCIVFLLFAWPIYSVRIAFGQEMDFETALDIVRSQNVVMDIKEHEIPGTKKLVNDPISVSQMADMESKHSEAIRIALRGIEELAKNLPADEVYRRVDGLGNNVLNPRWGGAFHVQNRLLNNSYSDGIGQPRTKSKSGNPLPSARTVSLRCFLPSLEEASYFDRDTSQLFFQLGQFVDHDVIATALEVAFGCCSSLNDTSVDTPCFTIPIEPGDRFFKGNCMNFRRAFGLIVNGVREQINTATSFLDASTVYGSNEAEVTNLRQFQGGLLKVTKENMLPLRDMFPCVRRFIPKCPLSGDSRVSEVPGLSATHLIFHREHNRLAQKLAEVNPNWSDQKLFQEARKINIAQLQKIVYTEFLPKLLGPDIMRILGIDKPYKYDPNLNPSIINVFGGAAFRFGHTLLSGIQYFHKGTSQALSELFFRPETVLYQDEALVRDVVLNQARRFAHKFDRFFTTEITDKLYLGVDSEAEPGESFDLLARNVQRGRDHGLQTYLEYLQYCMNRTRNIGGLIDFTLPTCLNSGIYESIADIDIFPGGIYETPLTGGTLGLTFACIIGEQFYRLKFGDRYFFETPDQTIGFKTEQLAEIQETAKLSALICRNTAVKEIQHKALESRRSIGNKKQPCSNYRDLNFRLWKESPK